MGGVKIVLVYKIDWKSIRTVLGVWFDSSSLLFNFKINPLTNFLNNCIIKVWKECLLTTA